MKLIPNAISRTLARQALVSQKNSPTILFGAGIVGIIGSTVLACRATLKIEEVLDTTNRDLAIAEAMETQYSSISPEKYSEEDRKKDALVIYARTIGKIGRLYAPSVILGAASIGALTKSHNMLNERNVALTAAYAAVDKAFKEYRTRVVDKYGEQQDQEFRYETESIEVHDEETGKTETVTRVHPDEHSQYARFFDQMSPSWSKEPEYNLLFLQCQQKWANDLLLARGHIFLNEVYDSLGIGRSKAGAIVGWVLSDDGDNFVDFGVFEGRNAVARDFVNGREGSILLDFNVDGVIFDKISNHGERLQWQR